MWLLELELSLFGLPILHLWKRNFNLVPFQLGSRCKECSLKLVLSSTSTPEQWKYKKNMLNREYTIVGVTSELLVSGWRNILSKHCSVDGKRQEANQLAQMVAGTYQSEKWCGDRHEQTPILPPTHNYGPRSLSPIPFRRFSSRITTKVFFSSQP